ncbi:MAG: MFS transporter [Candidatus Latescibacterota bacterium]|nr:MAG: MFS transporter [Candidatus Latescibacterota bacterium]
MDKPQHKYYKRNFLLGVVNGSLINVGMAFLDPFTVLPVFILKLGGSAVTVGLVSALHGVGWFLPQVLGSRLAETRRYLMNLYRLTSIPRVLGFVGIAVIVFSVDVSNKTTFLTAFIFAIFFAYFAGGLAGVPMLEIVSKTIPATRRGGFFGMRRFVGGILGIFAGMIVGVILGQGAQRVWMGGWVFDMIERGVRGLGLVGHAFPTDFGIVFLLGAICISCGTIVFFLAGEPSAASVKESARLLDHVRSGLTLLREDANYRRFYLARICWQFTAMAFPFYASYACDQLRISEHMVGLFLSVWVGSGVFSNYVWGQLMDRKGNKIVLTITAVLAAVPPLIVLGIDAGMGPSPHDPAGTGLLLLVSGTFCINGFIRSGRLISNITYLLEFAPETKRPLYVGFMNSFTFPFMLSPVFGGILIQIFNIRTLFWISMVFAIVNVYLSTRLKEPRNAKA